jgi:hypothetical protein
LLQSVATRCSSDRAFPSISRRCRQLLAT